MPRTPRNPGAGKPPHNGPAKGAGSGLPMGGSGQSWGGPAKGAGKPAAPFTADSPTRVTWANADPAKALSRAEKAARDERRAEEMRDVLYGLATTAENEMARKSAAEALLNRLEGMPIARTIAAVIDPAEEEKQRALAALGYEHRKRIEAVLAEAVGDDETEH